MFIDENAKRINDDRAARTAKGMLKYIFYDVIYVLFLYFMMRCMICF